MTNRYIPLATIPFLCASFAIPAENIKICTNTNPKECVENIIKHNASIIATSDSEPTTSLERTSLGIPILYSLPENKHFPTLEGHGLFGAIDYLGELQTEFPELEFQIKSPEPYTCGNNNQDVCFDFGYKMPDSQSFQQVSARLGGLVKFYQTALDIAKEITDTPKENLNLEEICNEYGFDCSVENSNLTRDGDELNSYTISDTDETGYSINFIY